MTTKEYIKEAMALHPYYNFVEQQMIELTEVIEKLEIAKSYNEEFITYYEGINMILHHASEIESKYPNKGAFPKPPQSNNENK